MARLDAIEAHQKDVAVAIVDAATETAEVVNGLESEIVALKGGIRTFGKKPFSNKTTRTQMQAKYVDPYAKFRKEQADLDEKTRPKNK